MNRIITGLVGALWALASFSANAHYMGDHPVGDTAICRFFTTTQPTTGAPFALAGSPTVEIYKDGSDVEDTDDSGVTLTASVDSIAGQNRICIDASSDGTFYSAGSFFSVQLESGTVDGVSVVGQTIMSFSLNNGAAFARVGAPAGASIAADLVTIDNFVDDLESRLGTPTDFGSGTSTVAGNLQDLADDGTATFSRSTDSLQAIRDRGDAAWTGSGGADPQGPAYTTVATAPTTTTVTLTAAPNDDTQLPGFGIYFEDNGDADSYCLRKVVSVSSGTITYDAACPFTVAASDVVKLLPAFLDEGVGVSSFEAAALANLFDTDSGETAAGAVAGSPVYEIGQLAASGGITVQDIVDGVLDEDMTAHQTQGTLGQAIGDPAADTNTIYKAVVTDAAGATVGVDGAAILDDTGTTGVLIAAGEATEIQAAAAAALNAEDGANFTAIPKTILYDYIEQFACDSGTTSTCVDAGLGEADGFWRGVALRSLSGTTAGMERCVTASDQSSTDVTVTPAFPASLGTGTVQLVASPLCAGVDPAYTP